MTTPRVTEIPLQLAAVEPDPFLGELSHASPAQRPDERGALQPKTEAVRRLMRARARARAGPRWTIRY